MADSDSPQELLWLEGLPPRPLCDVPWMGNTVVLANGDVNFCCFSDTVVGNVQETPLRQIWNNDRMRGIRRALRDQSLPPECRSPSCPIFRGDENHVILTRMEGAYHPQRTGTSDPHAAVRARFAGTLLSPAHPGGTLRLEVRYEGAPVCVDVYLAVRGADRAVRFLPRLEEVPFPARVGVRLPADAPFILRWPAEELAGGRQGESYTACAALFESGSHPNIASNCYWFTTRAWTEEGIRPDGDPLVERSVP